GVPAFFAHEAKYKTHGLLLSITDGEKCYHGGRRHVGQ
ncbi:MAG: hypothetical protein JWP72_2290, partial [Massilia sp.]|nr:hypothetical protein [Massilia sp.]